jgi:hypothetical protein
MNGSTARVLVAFLGMCFVAGSLAIAARTPQMKSIEAELQQVWTGTLVDAACKAADASGACEVSQETKAFGLQTADGKFYKFDANGNSKAGAALQKAANKTGAISVTVTGSMEGDTIKVASIQAQ